MARSSQEVLREALRGSAGLDDVVESLGGPARGALMNALEHVDAIVTPPPSTDAPPASPVAAKRKPAL